MIGQTPARRETRRRISRPRGVRTRVTQDHLRAARAGDERAFRALTDPYRRELHVHCYRILGSAQDAEDALQETMVAAWRGLDEFGERSSLRAWLYRIATNRCLNALRDRSRRPQEVQAMVEPPEPTRRTEPTWFEPYPDVARPYGLIVVALAADAVEAITWFGDTAIFRHFGLPRTLPHP